MTQVNFQAHPGHPLWQIDLGDKERSGRFATRQADFLAQSCPCFVWITLWMTCLKTMQSVTGRGLHQNALFLGNG